MVRELTRRRKDQEEAIGLHIAMMRYADRMSYSDTGPPYLGDPFCIELEGLFLYQPANNPQKGAMVTKTEPTDYEDEVAGVVSAQTHRRRTELTLVSGFRVEAADISDEIGNPEADRLLTLQERVESWLKGLEALVQNMHQHAREALEGFCNEIRTMLKGLPPSPWLERIYQRLAPLEKQLGLTA